MQPGDRDPFGQLLADAMAFYGQELGPFAASVWWEACKGFDFDAVAKAFTAHAMSPDRGHFAPKPADIVRHLAGTTADRAALAWGKALDAAARVGAYSDVVFDDAAIHAAIEDLGGWPKFCRTETAELSYLQHRFGQSYQAYAGRHEGFAYPRCLRGERSPDEIYTRRGLPPPKPAVVGDVERARAVYRLGEATGKTAIAAQALAALEAGPKLIADSQQGAAA